VNAENRRGRGGSGDQRRRRRKRSNRRPRSGQDNQPAPTVRPSIDERLEAVDRLLAGTVTDAGGLWSRATAWVLRLTVEQAVDQLWARVAPELMRCPMRAQLLALRTFVAVHTAIRVAALWSALSHAAHHHDYEIAPAATELRRWREETAAIVAELGAAR